MKNAKAKILACLVLAAPLLFVSATWEGAADVAPGRNPHGETYAIATNAFPRNMVVDVTNLENNRSVRVLVVSGQSNVGILGSLSRGAARSIGINEGSVSRIRISQPSDSIAFAHIRRGPLPDLADAADLEPADAPFAEEGYADVAEIPGYEPALADAVPFVEEGLAEAVEEEAEAIAYAEAEDEPELMAHEEAPFLPEAEPTAVVEYLADYPEVEPVAIAERPEPEPVAVAERPEAEPTDIAEYPETAPLVAEIRPNGLIASDDTEYEPARPVPTVMHEPQIYIPDFRFKLVPTEERLPPVMEEPIIAAEHVIPPIEPEERPAPVEVAAPVVAPVPPPVEPVFVEPMVFVDPIPDPRPRNVPSFHAVSNLERNMWYVQLGAFRYACSVEEEISRIGTAYPYPVLVQNIGTDSDPMFRVLLGPLNQGESAAVLRRIRSVGNTQAFVRQAR